MVNVLIVTLLGATVGLGAGRAHPATNPGVLLSIACGAFGGWLAATIWGPALAPSLGDSTLAGATAASVLGALALTLLVGAAWNRRPRASTSTSPPDD